MTPVSPVQLLSLLEKGPTSAPRVCKALGIAQSQLNRMLTVLGTHGEFGGAGLVHVQELDGRQMLSLTDKGRARLRQPA